MTEQQTSEKKNDVGSVFISNYPPFSTWESQQADAVLHAFSQEAQEDTPLGLYIHIPFCRKRCKFCYFKVYTNKNSKEIQNYLDNVFKEIEQIGQQPAIKGRKLNFLYVGGGTPSYISAKHLRNLVATIGEHFDLSELEEFTFECEPGTLTEAKLKAIQDVGVTRLSLGVENFDDHVLEENGRAHVSTEVYKVRPWIRDLHFGQLNIDLIAGMVDETWDNWRENIRKAIDYDPDSITIYQLELPFNTVYSHGILEGSSQVRFSDWETKRAWHDYAINTLTEAGYEVSSAYTMVRKDRNVKFRYRDALWRGADLLAAGVSSFGHLNGVHYQNETSLTVYGDRLAEGQLPVKRAFYTNEQTRLIREMILQLKLGKIEAAYFQEKYGVNILEQFAEPFQAHQEAGFLNLGEDSVTLTRKGLLQVDSLLPAFYEEKYQNVRYT